MTGTKEKILQKFNAELGSDLERPNKIYEFHQRLIAQKNEIEKSVRICKLLYYLLENFATKFIYQM